MPITWSEQLFLFSISVALALDGAGMKTANYINN